MVNLKSRLSEYFFGTNTGNKLKYFGKFNSEFYDDIAKENVQKCKDEEKMYKIIGKYIPNIITLLGISTPVIAYANENSLESFLFGTAMGILDIVVGESLRYYIKKREERVMSITIMQHLENVQNFHTGDRKDLEGEEWKNGTDYNFC